VGQLALIVGYGVWGFHARFARGAQALTGHFYLQVVLCWLPIWAICTLVSLPAAVYYSILDRKYGISNSSTVARLIDALKANALSLVTGGLIIEIAFVSNVLFHSSGWLLSGLLCSILFWAITSFMPWFLSFFYPVVPLKEGSLLERIAGLARKASMQLGTVYEWKISGHTRQANALVYGVGRTRRILLTDTMISVLSEEEMEAIIAHELGHCAFHHVLKRLALQGVLFCGIFWIINTAVGNGLVWFADQNNISWADLKLVPGVFCLWSFGYIYANLIVANLSRRQEKTADRYSWKLMGTAKPFIAAMHKLNDLNLIVFDKSSQWRYHHPPTADRVLAAEQYAQESQAAVSAPDL